MGLLRIDLFNQPFTVQTNETDEYAEKLYNYYKHFIQDVSKIPSIKSPLQVSILAGIMLCDELYKSKEKVAQLSMKKNLPPENITDGEELEKITVSLIDKINKVL